MNDRSAGTQLRGTQYCQQSDDSCSNHSEIEEDSLGNHTDNTNAEWSFGSDFSQHRGEHSMLEARHPGDRPDVLTILDDDMEEVVSPILEEAFSPLEDVGHFHAVHSYAPGDPLLALSPTADAIEASSTALSCSDAPHSSFFNDCFAVRPVTAVSAMVKDVRDAPCIDDEERPPSRRGRLAAVLMDASRPRRENPSPNMREGSFVQAPRIPHHTDPSISIESGYPLEDGRPSSLWRGDAATPPTSEGNAFPENFVQPNSCRISPDGNLRKYDRDERAPPVSCSPGESGAMPWCSASIDESHDGSTSEPAWGRPPFATTLRIEDAKKWDRILLPTYSSLLDWTFFSSLYWVQHPGDEDCSEEGNESASTIEEDNILGTRGIFKVFYFHPSDVSRGPYDEWYMKSRSNSVCFQAERSAIIELLEQFIEITEHRQQAFVKAHLMPANERTKVEDGEGGCGGKLIRYEVPFRCSGYKRLHLDSSCRLIAELDYRQHFVSFSDIIAYTDSEMVGTDVLSFVYFILLAVSEVHDRGLAHGALHGGNVGFNASSGECIFMHPLGVLCNIFSPMDASFISPREAILCASLFAITKETTKADKNRTQSTRVGLHQLSHRDEAILFLMAALQQSSTNRRFRTTTNGMDSFHARTDSSELNPARIPSLEETSVTTTYLGEPTKSDDIYAVGVLSLLLLFGMPLCFGASLRDVTTALLHILEELKSAISSLPSSTDPTELVHKILSNFFFDSSINSEYAKGRFRKYNLSEETLSHWKDFILCCLTAGFASALKQEHRFRNQEWAASCMAKHALFAKTLMETDETMEERMQRLKRLVHFYSYSTYRRECKSAKYAKVTETHQVSYRVPLSFPYCGKLHRNSIFSARLKELLENESMTFFRNEGEKQRMRTRRGKKSIIPRREWYGYTDVHLDERGSCSAAYEYERRGNEGIDDSAGESISKGEVDLMCIAGMYPLFSFTEDGWKFKKRFIDSQVTSLSGHELLPSIVSWEPFFANCGEQSHCVSSGPVTSSFSYVSPELDDMDYHANSGFWFLRNLSESKISLNDTAFANLSSRIFDKHRNACARTGSEDKSSNPALPSSLSTPLTVSSCGIVLSNLFHCHIELTHAMPFIILNNIRHSHLLLPPCHVLLITEMDHTVVHGASTYILVQKESVVHSQFHVSFVELEVVLPSTSTAEEYTLYPHENSGFQVADILHLSYPYDFVFPGVSAQFFHLKLPPMEYKDGGNFGVVSDLWKDWRRARSLAQNKEKDQEAGEESIADNLSTAHYGTLHDDLCSTAETLQRRVPFRFSIQKSLGFVLSKAEGECGALEYPYSDSLPELGWVFKHFGQGSYDCYLLNGELDENDVRIEDLGVVEENSARSCFPFICIFSDLNDVYIVNCHHSAILICGAMGSVRISQCSNLKIFCLSKVVEVSSCDDLDAYIFATESCSFDASAGVTVSPFYLASPVFSDFLRRIVTEQNELSGELLQSALEEVDLEKLNVVSQENGVSVSGCLALEVFPFSSIESANDGVPLPLLIFFPFFNGNSLTSTAGPRTDDHVCCRSEWDFFEESAKKVSKSLEECFFFISLHDLIDLPHEKSRRCHLNRLGNSDYVMERHHRLHDLANPFIVRLPLSFNLRHSFFNQPAGSSDAEEMKHRKGEMSLSSFLSEWKGTCCKEYNSSMLTIDSLLIERICRGKIHVAQAVSKLVIRDCDGPLEIAVCAATAVHLIRCSHVTLRVACVRFTAHSCFHCHTSLHVNKPPLYICCGSMETSPFNVSSRFMREMLCCAHISLSVNNFLSGNVQYPSSLQSLLARNEAKNENFTPEGSGCRDGDLSIKRLQDLFHTIMGTPPLPPLCIGEPAPLLDAFVKTLKSEEERRRATSGQQWASVLQEIRFEVSQGSTVSNTATSVGTGIALSLDRVGENTVTARPPFPTDYVPPRSPSRTQSNIDGDKEENERKRSKEGEHHVKREVENGAAAAPTASLEGHRTLPSVVKHSMRLDREALSSEREETSSCSESSSSCVHRQSSKTKGETVFRSPDRQWKAIETNSLMSSSSGKERTRTECAIHRSSQNKGETENPRSGSGRWAHSSAGLGPPQEVEDTPSIPFCSPSPEEEEPFPYQHHSTVSTSSSVSLVPTCGSGWSRNSRTGLLPPPPPSYSSEDSFSSQEEEESTTYFGSVMNRSELSAKMDGHRLRGAGSVERRGEEQLERVRSEKCPCAPTAPTSSGEAERNRATWDVSPFSTFPENSRLATGAGSLDTEAKMKPNLLELLSLVEVERRRYFAARKQLVSAADESERPEETPSEHAFEKRVVAAIAKLREEKSRMQG